MKNRLKKELEESIEDQFGVIDYQKEYDAGNLSLKDIFEEAFLLGVVHQIDKEREQHKNWEDRFPVRN